MPRKFASLISASIFFSILHYAPCCNAETLPPINASLEQSRQISASDSAIPQIDQLAAGGTVLWSQGQSTPAILTSGTSILITGTGFGQGPDVDYSKIILGTSRVLERDLPMYQGSVELLKKLFYEQPVLFDEWQKEILSWTDTQIEFIVPWIASEGPLTIQVQKRIGANTAIQDPSALFSLWDPFTERITDPSFVHVSDVVSQLGPARISNSIPLSIVNPKFQTLVATGEQIYWSYEFNLAAVHHSAHLNWEKILNGQATDPTTGQPAVPEDLFGAIALNAGEVPYSITQPIYWDPFPAPNPIKPTLRAPLLSGYTSPTKYVGYVYSESIDPLWNYKGNWIGMTCASCHSQRITYEAAPGQMVSHVFPGLPNPKWSMKWAALGNLYGVQGNEPGIDGQSSAVDKTNLLFGMPSGTGEHTLIRPSNDTSMYENDHLFSPIAIPIITRHTPVRRALSHTELITGFEGSYIHSEEPDGAVGAMHSASLMALTAYMTTLDDNNGVLQSLGIYRWLQQNGHLDEVNGATEGQFMQSGPSSYPGLSAHIASGKQIYSNSCASCHANNFGTWTDENMLPVTQVGTYFSPTMYERKAQSVRTSILHNLFWVEPRGLLHDGHVKSLEDLVNADRCTEGSDLYNRYYTLNPNTFHIPKGNAAQENALRNQAYFVDVPWDKTNLYWDYQGMRQAFGPTEFGTSAPVSLPATPHPWCVPDNSQINDLVQYLLTL